MDYYLLNNKIENIENKLIKQNQIIQSLQEKEKIHHKIIFNILLNTLNIQKAFNVHDYIDYLSLWNIDKNNFITLVTLPNFKKSFQFCKFLFFDLSFSELKYFLDLGTKYNFYNFVNFVHNSENYDVEDIIKHTRSKFFYDMIWNFANYMYTDFSQKNLLYLKIEEYNFIIEHKKDILLKIKNLNEISNFVFDENTHKFIKLIITEANKI